MAELLRAAWARNVLNRGKDDTLRYILLGLQTEHGCQLICQPIHVSSCTRMNATEEIVKRYVETFHRTLDEVSRQFFSVDDAKRLLHASLTPAQVTCYVSTQFGVAIEYSPSAETSINTVRGSARVEDLLVQAPAKLRDVGPMINVSAQGVGIQSLTLADGFPFRLSSEQADVTLRDVRFSWNAAGWTRDVHYAEVYGDRSAERWSHQSAESRAKDEVLGALFIARRAVTKELQLHEYISSFREKTVLVLGAYDADGRARLGRLAGVLKELGYDPVIIDDIPDFEHYDLSQKVSVIGALSRFVVIEDSHPSGHLVELEICRQHRWVTLLMRTPGDRSSWMTAGASLSSNVILEHEYDPSDPKPVMTECAAWAENRLSELGKKLNELYPWRIPS